MEFGEITRLVFITTLTIFISGIISPLIKKLLYEEKGFCRFFIFGIWVLVIMVFLTILILNVEAWILN